MAFFAKPEKNRPLIKKFNGPTKAHVHTYIQLCGISGHSGAFLTVFKNWENCGNFNGFLRQTRKEPTAYQEVQWNNKSSCTIVHRYIHTTLRNISTQCSIFGWLQKLGELREFQWLSSPNRKRACQKVQ